ncbi:MAG: Ig-like domain-containing protein [Prevotella sp.]|nr:Ig-like domain-containing protein [Prevotella sp.]
MKKRTVILSVMLCLAGLLHAEWTDVTQLFLKNPGFTNNSPSGWERNIFYGSNNMEYGCMEVYNGIFDVYQQLEGLPQGHYRLSVQAFYRAGDHDVAYYNRQEGNEGLTAELYADEAAQTLRSIYEFGFDAYRSDCWTPDNYIFYPDRMSSASLAFEQGQYWNQLEFDVDASGVAQVGIRNDDYVQGNWCIFDNFKLEYDGQVNQVMVKNITLTAAQAQLEVGERTYVYATVNPSNATVKDVVWATTNPYVVTVSQDGLAWARGEGTADVIATAVDGSEVSGRVTITVTKEEIADSREWTDVTSSFITNPKFTTNNSGWTVSSYWGSSAVRAGCQEFWNVAEFNVSQQLRSLPRGHYRLSVQGYQRSNDINESWQEYLDNNEATTQATLFAGDLDAVLLHDFYDCHELEKTNTYEWLSPADDDHYYPNQMETAAEAFGQGGYWNHVEFDIEEDGTDLVIGVRNDVYKYHSWCIFTNFRLETTDKVTMIQSLDATIGKTTLTVGETTQIETVILPDDASQKTLNFTTSDAGVATVDATGLVTACGIGQATITVSTIDGSELSKSFDIQVKAAAVHDWIDVTNIFIPNPSFAGNSTNGWTWSSNAQSQTCRAETMEFWNGTFDFWRDIKGAPMGQYRLSVQAYYRTGDNSPAYEAYRNGTEVIPAYMYAGDYEQALVSVYSYELPEALNGCWTYRSGGWGAQSEIHHFPNSMENAAVAFGNGAYQNVMEFEGGGNFTIGLYDEVYNNSNWCIFTNFRLEFKGDVVQVTSLSVDAPTKQLIVGETVQASATALPQDALQKNVRWASKNESVATVDQNGLITAVAPGTAVITASTVDGSNITASLTVTVTRNVVTEGSILINEIMASNVDEFVSPAYNFDGWVEFYNPTDKAVNMTGLYLSDNAAQLNQWCLPNGIGVLPAHGYKVVWFDFHTEAPLNAPFKLDVGGGTIYLSDGSGTVLAQQTYPGSMERVSYARTTDGGDTWGMAVSATPGASNAGTAYASQQLAAPVVNQPSQLFSAPFILSVTIPAGQTLRYTTDGTLPTLKNGETSRYGQFTVGSTSIYRFRLFADGQLPSPVTTRSFIYRDRDYTLPVVSVVSDPTFLYDNTMGVYVQGTNGRPGNGQKTACNWNMDWERPVNFSYLDANGEMVLNQDVNLEMCGGWSRAWNPHSFKLKGNKEFGGEKDLLYPFFSQKPFIRNRTLQIRNGGNDNNGRFKDPSLQYIIQTSGVDIDCQSYQPVHEFINGEYIGVLNVREPNNKHYVYANYGWDDDEIDQFEMSPDSGYVQKCGTPDAYNELVDVLSADAANPETYAEICRVLDIDNYVNYMAAEFYLGGTDWPQNNVKGYKLRDGGRFRFVMFDLDGVFATSDPFGTFMSKETYTFDPLYPESLGRLTDHIRFVTLFKNLLKNADFRRRFIDAYCLMGGSVLEANRAAEIISELQERVDPAMTLEGRQWDLNSSANNVRNSLNGRLQTANSALRNYSTFNLGSVTPQMVTLRSDVEGAQLLINGQQVPTGQFNGYLYAPVTLKAEAPAGYEFQGWLSPTASAATLKSAGSQWRYYDQGSLDEQNWTSPTYGESGWKTGQAPLGYAKDGIKTTLDYGSDSNNKRPTAYFRTTVQLQQTPKAADEFALNFTVDDGMIVYVNGKEAGRYNMPSGNVGYNSFASSYAPSNPDTGTMPLAASLFRQGSNTIAVELHNNSANSTDLMWDASVTTTATLDNPAYLSTDAEISLPQGNVLTLVASYRSLTQAERKQQGVSPVRINEVSGSNDSFVDEYGKKGDWLELYNATDEEVDVEGMYLTDNLQEPEKYVITKGSTQARTRIPAHGHLLVWCDNKRPTTDQGLHASFKIDGDGGVLQLMAADKSWKDVFYYGGHDANTTVGRYPDGGAGIYNMNVATIASTNRMSSYAQLTDQDALKAAYEEQTGIRPTLASSANGFRVRYGSQQLIVKGEDVKRALVELYTTDGRLIEQMSVRLTNGTARIDVSHLPHGFYVARATSDQTTRVACKFMK